MNTRYKLLKKTEEGFLVSPLVGGYRQELVVTYREHGWTRAEYGGLWVYRDISDCLDLSVECGLGNFEIWSVFTHLDEERIALGIGVQFLSLPEWRRYAHDRWEEALHSRDVKLDDMEMPIVVQRLHLHRMVRYWHRGP